MSKPLNSPTIPADVQTSPTWPYVLRFALAMEARLALPENRAKGDREGWVKDTPGSLGYQASRHVEHLRILVLDANVGHPDYMAEVLRRAVNAANFLMMMADASGALVPSAEEVTQPDATPLPQDAATAAE